MKIAARHFEREGWSVEDVSATCPHDLRCLRGGAVLYVEVKGTTTTGKEVILTRGEVEFARTNKHSMALYVVTRITVHDGGAAPAAKGGKGLLIQPWDVDKGTLVPIEFSYRLSE